MNQVEKRVNAFWLVVLLLLAGTWLSSTANAADSNLLKNIKVNQTVAGETFQGKLSITGLDLTESGQWLATGELKGKLDGQNFKQAFSDLPLDITEGGEANECDILFLDLGPLFLDVLGLQIDLSQITLDITAVAGSGNLLGNLLCAVVGLLDNFTLDETLNNILNNILEAINELL